MEIILMILIDWTNVAITAIMARLYKKPVDEDIIRHGLMEALATIISMFSKTYTTDEIIICTDNGSSWRKKIFKHYKSHRKADRQKDKERWDEIFVCLNKITEEVRENFPYKVVGIDHMEADDIIAAMTFKYSASNDILIVSNDKDFIQLQSKSVKQYSPMKRSFIKEINPDKYLYEHILKGDRGDSIPNFLSPEDCFVTGVRQTSVHQKKIDEWFKKTPAEVFDDEQLARYNTNKMLIDLTMIPQNHQDSIIENFKQIEKKDTGAYGILKYLSEHNLINLTERVNDFV